MHDPTEGGILMGLYELASAGEISLAIDRDAIPISEVTIELCAAAGVDPLRIFSSGVLLATVSVEDVESAIDDLEQAGIDASVIGQVAAAASPSVILDDVIIDTSVRDEMYPLWG